MHVPPCASLDVKSLYRCDKVHTAVSSPDQLSDEHITQYHREGFLAIERIIAQEDVDAAKAALSDLIAADKSDNYTVEYERSEDPSRIPANQRELSVRKLMYFARADARLQRMAEHPVLLDIVRRLVGSDVKMTQDMALLKPPLGGREKPWHQDTAYFLWDPPSGVIGTWTALDEATIDNGCMHVIPGSHLQGPRPHHHLRDCQMDDGNVEVHRDVVVPLRPGGVLFFSGLIHHGTPPNESASRRRALQFHYVSLNSRKMSHMEHARLFHNGDDYAGCVPRPKEF